MSKYETLSLLISLLAAGIAAYALFRGHRLSQKQIELQTKQAELAALQHKLMVREQAARSKADLRATFVQNGKGHKFVLKNVGATSALNVRLTDAKGSPAPDPLIASQAEALFPLPELRQNESVSVIAALHLGMKIPVDMIVTWDDESGSDQQRELKVQIG